MVDEPSLDIRRGRGREQQIGSWISHNKGAQMPCLGFEGSIILDDESGDFGEVVVSAGVFAAGLTTETDPDDKATP